MENVTYIKTDTEYSITQAIPGSASSDNVTISIVRLSDTYYWDFSDEEFQSGAHSGTMDFVAGTFWSAAFTPDEDDTYLITITDVTLGLTYTQALQALGDADSFTFRTNSEVSICNYALTKIGASAITSLSDSSEQARKCSAVYTRVRDRLLRSHPWNFAIKRDTLALLSETPEYGYAYAYALPTDCLRYLSNSEDAEVKIEGGKIFTDASTMAIKYIAKITDPSAYSASFVEAFATALAAEVCFALTDSRTLTNDLKLDAASALVKAKSEDAQEGTPDEPVSDEWLNARG